MHTHRRLAFVALLAGAAMLSASCSSPKGEVSKGDLKTIRAAEQSISPGMSKADVMARYKKANMVRLSSARMEGATIEEWKAEAFNDSGDGRDLSVRFLYFCNDVLADMSDARIDFRGDAALVKQWAATPHK